jgi:hypothetical protein
MVPELQGYRHRMQLTFIIAWCQFHAIWTVFQAGAARAGRKLAGGTA